MSETSHFKRTYQNELKEQTNERNFLIRMQTLTDGHEECILPHPVPL